MKTRIGFVLLACCSLLIFIRCQDSAVDPEMDSALNARISLGGAPSNSFEATQTTFTYDIDPYWDLKRMDTVIRATGSNGEVTLHISLVNISEPGIYLFNTDSSAAQNRSVHGKLAACLYETGSPFGVSNNWQLYGTGPSDSPGSITIDSISSSFIQGSFTANCSSSNFVQITNGTFKGYLRKLK